MRIFILKPITRGHMIPAKKPVLDEPLWVINITGKVLLYNFVFFLLLSCSTHGTFISRTPLFITLILLCLL